MTIQQKDYDPALTQGAANTVVLPQTITDATSSAFAVGPNGATNPGFQVDGSVSSAANGVKVIGRATGTRATLQVIGSGTDEGMEIQPKAAGTILVGGQVQPIITGSGATVTLTKNQSGSAVLFDRAAGIVFTLPANTPGMVFDFFVTVTITGGAAKVITAVGTELLVGTIINTDTDSSDAVASWKSLVAASNIAVSMNGTTTGGIKGDWFRFTCLNTTTWNVSGFTLGTSTVATPFASS
jgi:hypothetical protein